MGDRTGNSQSGAALLELLVGATVVLVVLASMTLAMVSQGRLRRTSEEQNLAMVACRNNLEQIRELNFSEIAALNNTGFDVPDESGKPGVLQAVAGDPDGLPGQFLVTVDDTDSGETLYQVRMVVTWAGVSGRQVFELKSLVADRKGT